MWDQVWFAAPSETGEISKEIFGLEVLRLENLGVWELQRRWLISWGDSSHSKVVEGLGLSFMIMRHP